MRKLTKGILATTLTLSMFSITACDSNDSITSSDDPQVLLVNGNGHSEMNQQNLNTVMSTIALEPVSAEEEEGMVFMREEEKLARDVYIALFEAWSMPIFSNISSAEQTHTTAISYLLDRYDIDDPMTVDQEGVCDNETLQGLYDALVEQGQTSLIEALTVGMTIEEIDILDLERELAEVVDNADITMVYENLLRGSRNHLRAFYSQLTAQGVDYEPQYMTVAAFETIINTAMERGGPNR